MTPEPPQQSTNSLQLMIAGVLLMNGLVLVYSLDWTLQGWLGAVCFWIGIPSGLAPKDARWRMYPMIVSMVLLIVFFTVFILTHRK